SFARSDHAPRPDAQQLECDVPHRARPRRRLRARRLQARARRAAALGLPAGPLHARAGGVPPVGSARLGARPSDGAARGALRRRLAPALGPRRARGARGTGPRPRQGRPLPDRRERGPLSLAPGVAAGKARYNFPFATREEPMDTVGFIGLGTMGMPMATNLARAGVPLVVHDVNPAAAAASAATRRRSRRSRPTWSAWAGATCTRAAPAWPTA